MKKPTKIVIICSLCLVLILGIVASVFLFAPKTEKEIPWVLFTEDFEAYQVGEDTFFDAAADETGAAFPWWDGMSNHHGSSSAAGYAQYGIGADSGNQYLQLTSVNNTKNWVVTKNAVSGPYTVKLDFQLTAGAPQFVVDLFQGSSLDNTVLAYIEPTGARIYNRSNDTSDYVQTADKTPMALSMNIWYTMEYGFQNGQVTLSVQKTGDDASKQSVTKTIADIIPAVVGSANAVRLQVSEVKNSTNTVLVDNFSITKNIDLTLQKYVSAGTGKVMDTLPVGNTANQLPALSYSYTLADPALGSTNADGQLVAGNAEGQTELTMNLLDIRGKETGITFKTTLVVDNTNAISLGDDIQFSLMGCEMNQTITPVLADEYKGATIQWTSSNESVVTVKDGVLTCQDRSGTAQITAMILGSGGKPTHHYDTVQVLVSDPALKVLSIGSTFTRDTLYYLNQLADAAGDRPLETAYLMMNDSSVHDHAYNLSFGIANYDWYATNANGVLQYVASNQAIADKVESQKWDVIIIQHDIFNQGVRGSYNGDLKYVVDYLEDVQPDAKLLWNMTWAMQDRFSSSIHGAEFRELFSMNQNTMYNNIAAMTNEYIVGDDALFSSTNPDNIGAGLGWGFDGCIANGTAIQNLRQVIDHDRDLTRDGSHLSLDVGRMTAALMTFKALYPDRDLSDTFAANVIADIIVTDKQDYDSATGNVMATDKSTYTYTDADLPKIIAAVEAALETPFLSKLPIPEAPRPEKDNPQASNSVTVDAPQKLHFPDVKVLEDGTLVAGAYECLAHYPIPGNDSSNPYEVLEEGVGRVVFYESTDNGNTWGYDTPILVVDEAQLIRWGIFDHYSRYEKLGIGSGQDYITYVDPRDPNLGTVYVDFDNDGDVEQVLLATFWERSYTSIGKSCGYTLWLITGIRNVDGTYTWAPKPTRITGAGIKRGDITSFSDGTILVPTYSGDHAYCVNMSWAPETKSWKQNATHEIPNLAAYEDTTFNEVSLVAPDPDSDTVYAFCRQNGVVERSDDRGATWVRIGNESGKIHQPGFAIIDENRIFVTWAKTSAPRSTWGKIFYLDRAWEDSPSNLIYATKAVGGTDTGDPSCAYTADGKIVVVSYDTYYRSIVNCIIDPEDPMWLPKDAT